MGVWVSTWIGAVVIVVIAESDILLSAPDIFLQSRIIDKRIAVLLAAIHGIVAVYLFLAYGVLLCPAQQHLDKP